MSTTNESNDHTSHHSVWSSLNASSFQVRSKSYLHNKVKSQSEDFLFPCRGVELFILKDDDKDSCNDTNSSTTKTQNIGKRYDQLLSGTLRDKPTLLINFRFPWGVLVLYFEIPKEHCSFLRHYYHNSNNHGSNARFDSTTISCNDDAADYDHIPSHLKSLYRFFSGDVKYKNSKFKLIAKIVEGNIILRKLVTGKPILIGNKLPVEYIYEPSSSSHDENGDHTCTPHKAEYFEIDLDIGNSSKTAKQIVGLCRQYMNSLCFDIGFVIEGDCEDELPERMLGGVRIHHLDPSKCSSI